MDKLMIPPNPNWFMQSICYSTPDNGLLYGAMSKIVYIPPKPKEAKAAASGIRIFDLKNKLCSFSIFPRWNESKRFSVINADFNVLIYDFTSGEVIGGHKGHEHEIHPMKGGQHPHTSIAFLSQNIILSSVNSNIISFCVQSNTYKIFIDFSGRNPITILKQSPKNQTLVAAGTKNGLILLISLDKMEVVARLRGHDTEISSLDFIYLSMRPAPVSEDIDKKSTLEQIIASTDTSDVFGIYEDSNDAEFGVYASESIGDRSDDEEDNKGELQEKIVSNSNFNFIEACNSLKGEILGEGCYKGESSKGTFEDNRDRYGVKNAQNPSADESLASNASSRTPVLTEESLNFLDECQRMKDFVIVTKEEVDLYEELPVLASGSREQVAWLWDINERTAFSKIKWHPKTRPVLPAPFTNVLWIDESTLLLTDGNGDIIEYKVSLDIHTRVLTCKEVKEKTFDAKGVLNMCKSQDSSVVWTSSIHRHISCLDVHKDYEKIISLDTIQLRIHYIVENPIDSNLIAIGGNDKRICLWNTSEANESAIGLRPFMNKIQSGVLNLSWHPEKDNILAFSTREGRIGVLDVNKSSNLPVILTSFSSSEIYSISWAKLDDHPILIACNGQKSLVYYTQKDLGKMHYVDHLKHSASVAVNGKILAVGSNNGELSIVDITNNFSVIAKKSVCKKYIGMMTWHCDKLAISTESGIVVIKNIESEITEIKDENVVKLTGHKGRVFSVRFNKEGTRLVSCCFGGFVKVWDLTIATVLSSISIDTLAYSAIFLPENEDFIICGGQDSTVLMFEWSKYPSDKEASLEQGNKKKHQQHDKSIQWAAPTEITTISKNTQRREKKVIGKKGEDSISQLSNEVAKLNLQTKKKTSIFQIANRELNTNPLDLIESILNDEQHELSLTEKIFGNRELVKEVIEKELKQKGSNFVILPQLNDSTKSDILERIANKSLTELHVAIAPSVSYDLWRKCCFAYATQCIENDDFLAAVPYFLAINDIDVCINQLCDGKFFREAFVIAKMRKEESDLILKTITDKWVAYYDYSGNFEAAAALLACLKDYKKAAEILEKRQNKNEKCRRLIEVIAGKTV